MGGQGQRRPSGVPAGARPSGPPPGRPPEAEHHRCGPGRRRLVPDRVPGHHRFAGGECGDARAGAGGDRRARLSPQQRGDGLGHQSLDHDRDRHRQFAPLRPVATLLALESAAREAGYGSSVVGVKEPYSRTVPEAMASLGDAGVDGIIVIAPLRTMATAVRKVQTDVPVEIIAAGASSSAHGRLFTFSENQELGARMATQHLIDLGHRDIAHVGGSMDWFDGRVRKRGWESALREADLTPGSTRRATGVRCGPTGPGCVWSTRACPRRSSPPATTRRSG